MNYDQEQLEKAIRDKVVYRVLYGLITACIVFLLYVVPWVMVGVWAIMLCIIFALSALLNWADYSENALDYAVRLIDNVCKSLKRDVL